MKKKNNIPQERRKAVSKEEAVTVFKVTGKEICR